MWAQSKKSRRAEVGKHPGRVRRSIGPSETSWGDENAAVNTSKNHPVFIPAACAASKGNQTILAWLASKGNQAILAWLASKGNQAILAWLASKGNQAILAWLASKGNQAILAWLASKGNQAILAWLASKGNQAILAWLASKGNQAILAWLASKGNQAILVWLPSGGPKPKPAKLTVRNRFRRKNKPVKWHDFHHPRNKLFGRFHGISLGFPGVDAPFEGLGVYVTILDVFDRQTGGCAFARSAAVENDGLVFGKLVDAGFQLAF